MSADDIVSKLREVRTKSDIKLKPSPYLRSSFVNEYGEDVPISIRNYQGQGILNLLMMERMILGDDTGLGKAQPLDSLVLTPDGWTRIGDIAVGDSVIGANGKPTEVLGVFPQGKKQAFRVTMSDGSSTECCEDHLWTVRTGNSMRYGDGWYTLSLKQIAAKGLMRQSKGTGLRWEIPVVHPVEFPESNLPIDPYLLGVILGDGSTIGALNISNGDPELFDIVAKHLPPDCAYGRVSDDGLTRNIVGTAPGYNSLVRALKEINVKDDNWYTKSIPESYLFASVNQRADLLRGLMDTDGYISKDGKVTQFYSSNNILIRDFVRLVQSLGGVAKIASKVPTLRGKSRAKRGRLAYIVTMSLPNWLVPFKLSRKVRRWMPRTKYFPQRRIASIEPSRVTECVCIKVAASDSLYVTDEYIVTHNTLMVLSTIGYVWLKEPEYVPIIVTTKSALYQWGSEVTKFMQGMEAVTVDGEPHARHQVYEEFFLGHDPNQKKLLLLTYDNIMRDIDEAIVKDRSVKSDAKTKKELKDAREAKKKLDAKLQECRQLLESHFDGRIFDVHEYVRALLTRTPSDKSAAPKPPADWATDDGKVVSDFITVRDETRAQVKEVERLATLVAPPKKVPGIIQYMGLLQQKYPNTKFMLVMDEMHKLKNHRSQFHEKTREVSLRSDRIIGMTATPVKNKLMEFFSLFRIIKPELFPKVTHFQNEYCVTKLQNIGGGRQIPIVVGYKNLDKFVAVIEPYYLSRKKYEVAKELPELISREIECELHELQDELYDMAESGLLEDDSDENGGSMLSSLTMVHQATNAPQLVLDDDEKPFEGPSAKIDALIDLLLEEAQGQKIIVYSKFERMISLIEKSLGEVKWEDSSGRKQTGIRCVRITGKENDPKLREKAKNIFQDPKSGTDVVLITSAGAESINLQAAEHFAFIDLPWSWGDYVQLTGRMVRIGSVHKVVVAHHFLARRRDGNKTVDHNILKALQSKKKLADKVAGESIQGGLKFIQDTDLIKDIFYELRNGVQAGDKGSLLAKVNAQLASKKAKVSKPSKSKSKNPVVQPKPMTPEEQVMSIDLDMSDL